jgi:PAS domain S-box-containing protein
MTRILVVDDEESIREMMRMSLELDGYEVVTACDGTSALELFRAKAPDVVLLDVRMPGMDGVEVLRAMKEMDPAAEVIIVTGHGDMEMAIDCLRQEAANFLLKPVSDEMLDFALSRSLERLALKRKVEQYTQNLETLLREGNAELEKAFRFRENLIDNSPDAIVSVRRNGVIVIFNGAAETLLGYRQEEVVGKLNIVNLYRPGVAKEIMKDLRSPDFGGPGRLKKREVTVIRKDGTEIPVYLSASILYDQGQEAGSVGIFTDLTERRGLERRMGEREEKSQPHADLNAALDRLQASVQAVSAVVTGNAQAQHALERVRAEAERIRAILEEWPGS